jgi:glycosyltransferase involved in cell wall biosynthesis
MKILLVHNSYRQPGGEDVVFDQECQLLERAGHHVVTYRRSNSEIEEDSARSWLELAKHTIWARDTRQQVAELIHREKPRLVHVHNTFMMVSPSVYAACRHAGVPVVQTLHNYRLACPAATFYRDGHVCEECLQQGLWRGVRHGCYRGSRIETAVVAAMLEVHRVLRTWQKMVDCYIALTEFSRRKLIAAGLLEDRVFTKPNFIHPDPGEPTGSGKYAIFVGRLSPEKGLQTLVAAWERIGCHIPVLIIGDGPERAALQAKVTERRISSISFQGRLTRSQTLVAIKDAKFLVLPSQCYENFPMSIVEAFASGIPVICSRLGAMQELVTDGRTGLHFTPGDANDLAARVEWAWTHPREMQEMGLEARAEYKAKYTAQRNYELLMEIYSTAVAARDKGCSPMCETAVSPRAPAQLLK